jgi:hypothetical protein
LTVIYWRFNFFALEFEFTDRHTCKPEEIDTKLMQTNKLESLTVSQYGTNTIINKVLRPTVPDQNHF